MPKRKREKSSSLDRIRKKLRQLEQQVREQRRHRQRKRIIESTSSESSSREPSPTPQNSQEQVSNLNDHGGTVDDDLFEILACSDDGNPVHSTLTTPPSPPACAEGPSTDTAAPVACAAPSQVDLLNSIDILDDVTLEILGDDPSAKVEYSAPVHKEIASRIEHLALAGLNKEMRKELTDRYTVPSNCIRIGAPTLNDEIRAALPETVIKRDRILFAKQKQIATVISCVASTITDQLNCKEKNHDLLKKLMDMGRLLCDIQHTESSARRNFSLFSVKREMKDHLANTKLDTFLFGDNLSEALKTAKAVNKSGSDLKIPLKTPKKVQHQARKPQPTKNWRRPAAPARQQLGPQRSRDIAYQREQPTTSSKRSPPQPKTPHRR